MKKECLQCGGSFSGRSDAKFCSNQCRSTHHNHQTASISAYMRRVNIVLRKNRKILSKLNPIGKARVSKSDLSRNGFNFDFITNTYVTKAGKEYRFCYDQGYIHTGDDWFTLVVKHEYV